jgi:hypothetical protein
MADWTDILNSEVDTDSPITEALMTALRDNPVAIAEGASGAPTISNLAFDGTGVNRVIGTNALTRDLDGGTGLLQAADNTVYIPAGWYMALVYLYDDIAYFELYDGTTWRSIAGEAKFVGIIVSDGSNLRLRSTDLYVTAKMYYRKLGE